MRTLYKIAGMIFILACLLFLKYNYKEIITYKNGTTINALIIYVPNCISGKPYYHLKFSYNETVYPKRIGGELCDKLKEGDIIKLKTNDDNTVFLYEHENPYNNAIYFTLLIFFGLFLLYMGFKKTI
jgi:hypothetical protein